MTDKPFPTVLIGFGRIAAGYARDRVMARHIPYATHAQVLSDHPAFDWRAVIDPAASARAAARDVWGVPAVAAAALECAGRGDIEIAIVASPPAGRMRALDAFPNLRAVLVEKPLADSLGDARRLVETCRSRGILVAVNFMRRADQSLRALAAGGLARRIGRPQAAFGVYGNGLNNNGIHVIDMIRMLIGEVETARAVAGDGENPAFVLRCAGGVTVMVNPLDFDQYRENGLDIWGARGRMEIMHEGLTLITTKAGPHRYAEAEGELIHDSQAVATTGLGSALYAMYDNLAAALNDGEALVCSGDDALATSAVVDAVLRSVAGNGQPVSLERRDAPVLNVSRA